MSKLWSPFVQQLTPYVPGEQPEQSGVIKLNTNENPFPPSPRVGEAIRGIADNSLRLYPDPLSLKLRQVIAHYHATCDQPLSAENVFVGNGSDEVLAHLFNAFFRKRSPLLFPDITYSFYPVYCQLFGIEYRAVPLDAKLKIDVNDYTNVDCGGVIFANPNAPTGRLLGIEEIALISKANSDSVVVVDEAYIDFADNEKTASAINLVADHDNVLVVRTLSKSRALAGIRLGYAVGNSELIEALVRVKDSFNSYPIDCIAEAAAIASFSDEDYFQQKRKLVIDERKTLVAQLEQRDFAVIDSAANFVLVKPNGCLASDLAAVLREKNIFLRYFDKPRLRDFLRITVGDSSQNTALIAAIDQFQKI